MRRIPLPAVRLHGGRRHMDGGQSRPPYWLVAYSLLRSLLPAACRLLLTVYCILPTFLLLASCNQLKQWRAGQVQQSHKIAQGSAVTPPAQPPSVPDSVRAELPLDPSFTVLMYYNTGDSLRLTALSAWDAAATAQWLVGKLGELGYDSGDNPSRVLEGADYARERGEWRKLYVKLSLNTAEQCTVELRAQH